VAKRINPAGLEPAPGTPGDLKLMDVGADGWLVRLEHGPKWIQIGMTDDQLGLFLDKALNGLKRKWGFL